MIEIDHKRAKYLIDQGQDFQLSAELWSALEHHMEQCLDCQNYRTQLQSLSRNLSKSLQIRMETIPGPSDQLQLMVIQQYRKRAEWRRIRARVYASALILILFLFISPSIQPNSEAKTAQSRTRRIARTLSPTQNAIEPALAAPGKFSQIIAYESKSSGNAEVFLLNPGYEPVNLTNHPADDTNPIWSPDGQWLAFLSNRSTNNEKNEIFVTSIAGNHLVQLTNEPSIDWQAPLSWSADGKWIAAAGIIKTTSHQNQFSKRFINLVGMDGSKPVRLDGSQGGFSPKFAPYGDRLAFLQIQGDQGQIVIYQVDITRSVSLKLPQYLINNTMIDFEFSWPEKGHGRYSHTVQFLPFLNLRVATSIQGIQSCWKLGIPNSPKNNSESQQLISNKIDRSEGLLPVFVGANQTPIYMIREEMSGKKLSSCTIATNCYGYPLYQKGNLHLTSVYPDLCILSRLDNNALSLDHRWLIFSARSSTTDEAGLYALRMPDPGMGWSSVGPIDHQFADLTIGALVRLSPVDIQTTNLLIRPNKEWLKIQPRSSW